MEKREKPKKNPFPKGSPQWVAFNVAFNKGRLK